MAYSDPQTLTVNAVAKTLPRISTSGTSSTYSIDDGSLQLAVSHSLGNKRTRRTARVNASKISADPLQPAYNVKNSMSAYIVVDVPPVGGYTLVEQAQIMKALTDWLGVSANATKLLGGES